MERTIDENGYAVYTLESWNPNRASGFYAKRKGAYNPDSLYWPSPDKGSMSIYCKAGSSQADVYVYWASVLFRENELEELRGKPVRKVLLTLNAGTGNARVGIDWKLNGVVEDFQRCDRNGAVTADNYLGPWYYDTEVNPNYVSSSGNDRTFDLTKDVNGNKMGVPKYGYVLGPISTARLNYVVVLNDGDRATDTEKRAVLAVTTNEHEVTLSFDANGGSGAPASVTEWSPGSVTLTVPAGTPTKTYKVFAGWSETSDGPVQYQPGDSITISDDKTLYAVWNVHYLHMVYRKGAQGSGADYDLYPVMPNSSVNVVDMSYFIYREGYDIGGYSLTDGGAKAYSIGDTITTADSDLPDLYPYWVAKTYTVSYNANGGSGAPASQTKTAFVTLTLSSSVPTKNGYTFTGWATSASGPVAYQPGGSYAANASVTLYAKWAKAGDPVHIATHEGIKEGIVYVETGSGLTGAQVYIMTADGLKEAR